MLLYDDDDDDDDDWFNHFFLNSRVGIVQKGNTKTVFGYSEIIRDLIVEKAWQKRNIFKFRLKAANSLTSVTTQRLDMRKIV